MLRFIFLLLPISLFAQTYTTSFENESLGQSFDKQDWINDGMNASWVSGFDARSEIVSEFSQDGSQALKISYPQGKYGTSNSGAQGKIKLIPADTYYLSYWLRFSDNFSWGNTSEGGKLPGLAGGSNCSGGSTCNGTNGFTCRYMWRSDGKAVLYLYHIDKPSTFGEDIAFKDEFNNAIYFPKGEWVNIIEKVTINSVQAGIAQPDGQVKIWYNGQLAVEKNGIRFVNNDDKVDLFYFSTFHGGSSSNWAPTTDSYIWYDDITISTDSSTVFNPILTSKASSNELDFAYVYPNPCTDYITWSHLGITHYALKNSNGQLVRKGTSDKINMRLVESGIYVLHLWDNHRSMKLKVVKKE